MRYAVKRTGLPLESSSPAYLLRSLYSDGLLDREEFERLDEAMKTRNAVVQGLSLPSLSPTTPGYVARVARKLLSNGTNGHG
jgi:hypothetical protein